MKKYRVHIEKTIERDVYIKAKDMHEAKSKSIFKINDNEKIKWIKEEEDLNE